MLRFSSLSFVQCCDTDHWVMAVSHLTHENLCILSSKVVSQNRRKKKTEVDPANSDSPGKTAATTEMDGGGDVS